MSNTHSYDPSKGFIGPSTAHSVVTTSYLGEIIVTDGGATWQHVLFVDEDTGCSDLAMDPKNPRNVFAGTWQFVIHTWGRFSGGPGGGLWVSRDGGATFTRLTGNGLPTKPVGKVAVTIAASNPQRVYAMFETGNGIPWNGQPTEDGQIWRSEDGGRSWRLVNKDREAMGRDHYYGPMAVSTDDPAALATAAQRAIEVAGPLLVVSSPDVSAEKAGAFSGFDADSGHCLAAGGVFCLFRHPQPGAVPA